jgi:hypothetical protein
MNTIMSLSDDELLTLLNDTESDLAERKKSFKGDTPDRARQAVCAFANDRVEISSPGGPYGNSLPQFEVNNDFIICKLWAK